MSQVVTTPAELLEITMPSLTCRPTDRIALGEVDIVLATTGSVDRAPICQNLTVESHEAEMGEAENMMELMLLVCPTRVSMR